MIKNLSGLLGPLSAENRLSVRGRGPPGRLGNRFLDTRSACGRQASAGRQPRTWRDRADDAPKSPPTLSKVAARRVLGGMLVRPHRRAEARGLAVSPLKEVPR